MEKNNRKILRDIQVERRAMCVQMLDKKLSTVHGRKGEHGSSDRL